MLSGATASAFAIVGTAVFKIVVSSDSMKKATATSHGNNRFTDSPGIAGDAETTLELAEIILVANSISDVRDLANSASGRALAAVYLADSKRNPLKESLLAQDGEAWQYCKPALALESKQVPVKVPVNG